MNMTLLNENIGFDKIKITQFKIEYIKHDILLFLMEKGLIDMSYNADSKGIFDVTTGNNINISKIAIGDDSNMNLNRPMIKFFYSVKGESEKNVLYVNLPKTLHGNNLNNVSTKEDIQKAIDIAIANMLDSNGIKLDLKQAKVSYIEINKTIELDNDFNYYKEPIQLIAERCKWIGKYSEHHEEFENGVKKYTGFSKNNTSTSLTWYAKLVEMGFRKVKKDYLRVEVKINKSDMFKQNLGDNSLEWFLDNTDKVIEWYKSIVDKKVIKPVDSHIKKQYKYTLDKIKELKTQYSRGYVNKFLTIGYIEDFDTIDKAILKVSATQKSAKATSKKVKKLIELRQVDNQRRYFDIYSDIEGIFKQLN